MPLPYHSSVLNGASFDITIYLEVSSDTDGPIATDNLLAEIDAVWGAIAAKKQITFTVALGPDTMANFPPSDGAHPPAPGGIGLAAGLVPPNNGAFFQLVVGRGKNARPETRSSRTSYVDVAAGTGYIYYDNSAKDPFVPAIAHELGHILGLSDRYFEGIYWLINWSLQRTCRQIRRDEYYVPPNDFRDGVKDTALHSSFPTMAKRVTLPISTVRITEAGYDPVDNLMSTGTATLTDEQICWITSVTEEPKYKNVNWVAILGAWKRWDTGNPKIPNGALAQAPDYPVGSGDDYWPFPAWEARPQDGGRGLLFQPGSVAKRYVCISSIGKAQHPTGATVDETRFALAAGKRRTHPFSNHRYSNKTNQTANSNPICHVRRTLNDLMRMAMT